MAALHFPPATTASDRSCIITGTPTPPPPYATSSSAYFHAPTLYHPYPQHFVWYPHPPFMDSLVSNPAATSSIVAEMDSFTPPEDLPSNSASPNSQLLGLENGGPRNSSPSSTTETRVMTPSVPAACLACRGKHLKCDGQTPCSRCSSANSECVYVASRRGYKGPRRGTAQNPNKRHRSSSPRDSTTSVSSSVADGPGTLPTTTSVTSTFNPGIIIPCGGSSLPFQPVPFRSGLDDLALTYTRQDGVVPAQVPVPTPAERCLHSFYHHFHAAHPFVLPKEYLLRKAEEGTIEPLLMAIRWIGSFYIDAGPARSTFFEEARRLAYEADRPKCAFVVQALMLLIIGLDGSGYQKESRAMLADAERIALQIGLNTRLFATLHGQGMPVLEESMRRTWWDLFVLDGMIAGIHRATNFVLFDVVSDVALPCEEHQYLTGDIPSPMYLEDLEDTDFSGEDQEFSSFAYRILCARNLGKFMRVPPIFGPDDENLARIEALLTNWRLHLPESKKDALYKDGKLDEMMFQAHMMLHATSILLHQPHSQIDSSPTRNVNSCAPHRHVPSGDVFNTHTKHTIQSANDISRLITHRVSILSHTPFFTCVVTLSSIVHLSKWALFFIPHNDDDLRQQIRLNIGALNTLSQVWTGAERASGQVKGVAQEIYRVKKQQQLTPQYWLGLTQEEVMSSMAVDDSIISEIESIIPSMPGLLG